MAMSLTASVASFVPALNPVGLFSRFSEGVSRHIDFLMTPHPEHWNLFFVNWTVQFVASWVAFTIYIVWDYKNYKANKLETQKLPSRHPLDPFWWSQLRMVPLVLYNQLVVWPLMFLLFVWPQWSMNLTTTSEWGWKMIPGVVVLLLISDQMWYWSHRLMHTSYCWKAYHRMHHIAEQTAISATYVHAVEYAMFTVAMNLPWGLAGFPTWLHLLLMGWGMFTGSGAHSGYSGTFANGDKHNAHHMMHSVNYGLLMVADAMFGTHWQPGDPAPKVWSEAIKIWEEFGEVHGTDAASTFLPSGHSLVETTLSDVGGDGGDVAPDVAAAALAAAAAATAKANARAQELAKSATAASAASR